MQEKNNRRSLMYGWGINDADYVVRQRVDGKTVMCPFYIRWISVCQRGNDPKEKERKPTYEQSFVNEEWRYFSNFRCWLDAQPYWQQLSIDKDILIPGNKEYGPSTCVLVPPYLNLAIVLGGTKNKYAYGVSAVKNKFQAKMNNTVVGSFYTWQEAHKAWQLAKAAQIEKVISQYATEPWFRSDVAEALTSRVWKLRLEARQGIQTLTL